MDENVQQENIVRLARKRRQQKQRKKRLIIAAVCVLAVLVAGVLAYVIPFRLVSPAPDKLQVYEDIGDGTQLRVGVMSDTQLKDDKIIAENGGVNHNAENLKKTLELFKAQKVDMIIHAGDIGDMCTSDAYRTYQDTIEEVFPNEKERPIFLNIMGNHDLWFNTDWTHSVPKHRLYSICMGSSPWVHYKVNGFHFIGASPDLTSNTQGYSEKVCAWLQEEIEAAQADTKNGEPIFVITHHNLRDTVYGSDEWYDTAITDLLSQYENVVSISGHSHFSILDERSINQKNLTAFTTQSIAYVETERGYFDPFTGGENIHPPYYEDYPMCLIMNVSQEQTVIERWNVAKNREEKANMRWTLTYPLEKGTFTYRDDVRRSQATAPVFPENAALTYAPFIESYREEDNGKTLPGIQFTAAMHQDFVHSYDVRLTDVASGKMYTYLYLSDFVYGISDMAKEVRLALDSTLPSARYKVDVYAIDSYGRYSADPVSGEIQWVRPADS